MYRFVDDDGNFVHPWGAQAAIKFHGGVTWAITMAAFPFRWLLRKALGVDKLEAKFQSIVDGLDIQDDGSIDVVVE